tara:strand:+ start:4553 stop:4789 length:237 start_codon:yes stop_codon:yes gene_type:complete
LALGPKTEIFYFAPPGIAKRQFQPPRRGSEIRKPRGRATGELFRLNLITNPKVSISGLQQLDLILKTNGVVALGGFTN